MEIEHVVVRKLEHLTQTNGRPDLGYAIEIRDRPGPAHKHGAFPDDRVWIQLHGGLFVAKARVELCWIGEYGKIAEVRRRTRGSQIHDLAEFWAGRPRVGYAAVASLKGEVWTEPFWAGPRTYGYEWILLENEKKRSSWLDEKEPPRTGDDLKRRFLAWRS